MIIKSIKIRIYPNINQKILLEKSFNLARYAWNLGLQEWNGMYSSWKSNPDKYEKPTINEIRRRFNHLVKPTRNWIKEPSSDVHDSALLNLGNAWKSFFKGISGKPKFKSKHHSRYSFTCQRNFPNAIQWLNGKIKLQKFAKKNMIKVKAKNPYPDYQIKYITISRDGNKYFASIIFSLDRIPDNYCAKTNNHHKMIGIDLGVKHLATLSNGKVYNQVDTTRIDKRIKKYQRKLSKKIRGSNNYEKVRTKLQNSYSHKSRMLNDNLQKVTTDIVRNYRYIAMEKLNSKNMMTRPKGKPNHKRGLSRRIADSQFYKFKTYLQYKCEYIKTKGGKSTVHLVNPRNTTQMCSRCGYIHSKENGDHLNLGDRRMECTNCGFVCDRDVNAAINIKHAY